MTNQEQELERKLNSELVSLNAQIYREKLRKQPDQARLEHLDTQLRKARLDYEQFQTALYAAHLELRVKRGEIKPISLEQAGELIPDSGTALLEFAVAKDKTFLFVLTKQQSSSATPVVKVYTINIKEKDFDRSCGAVSSPPRRSITHISTTRKNAVSAPLGTRPK